MRGWQPVWHCLLPFILGTTSWPAKAILLSWIWVQTWFTVIWRGKTLWIFGWKEKSLGTLSLVPDQGQLPTVSREALCALRGQVCTLGMRAFMFSPRNIGGLSVRVTPFHWDTNPAQLTPEMREKWPLWKSDHPLIFWREKDKAHTLWLLNFGSR